MSGYNPKPDLWSKIQQQRDFDAQVDMHAGNLPEKMPKADLWSSIESELDQKTPVIPLWKYGMAAASIALILAVSGIAYLQFGENEVETQLITEVTVQRPAAVEIEVKPLIQPQTPEVKAQKTEVGESKQSVLKLEVAAETKPTFVEVPTLDLPDLTIENLQITQVIIPAAPEQDAPQTLHRVQISWGLQDKAKLRTTFGTNSPEDISERQIGRLDDNSNSIKINLKKQ